MGENCGGGARRPRGGMAELLRPKGGPDDASPTIPRQPQAGHRRRSGWKHASGLEAGPAKRSIGCRRKSRTARWLGAPRGLPRGSTR